MELATLRMTFSSEPPSGQLETLVENCMRTGAVVAMGIRWHGPLVAVVYGDRTDLESFAEALHAHAGRA